MRAEKALILLTGILFGIVVTEIIFFWPRK